MKLLIPPILRVKFQRTEAYAGYTVWWIVNEM